MKSVWQIPITTMVLLMVVLLVWPTYVQAAVYAASIDQCRNGPTDNPQDCKALGGTFGWVNGNAGSSNAHYVEGQSIAYRTTVTGLTVGDTVKLRIGYDIKHSGKFAIDYLTFVKQGITSVVDPCDGAGVPGVTSCVDGAGGSFFDITTPLGPPNMVSITAPGTGVPAVPQPSTSFLALPASARRIVAIGGTITAVSYFSQPTAADLATADTAEVQVDITFTATQTTALLAWGGHIGSRLDWGFSGTTPLSAGGISGSPYHTRIVTIFVNGVETNLGSQDRSLSAGAVAPPPSLQITKTADAASVSAGSSIGFTITVTNPAGAGTATGVTINDPLPGGTGVTWTESPDKTECSITGSPPSQTLTCNIGDLAASASFSVHVTSPTTKDSCKVYPDTATAQATNNPQVQASASTEVLCGVIGVTKTADAASVSAGTAIGFTITVTNTGTGTATGVTLNDPLPAGTGVSWSISPAQAACSISGSPPTQTLACTIGDLAPSASFSVHVTSPTTLDSCKVYNNEATVTSTNDGSGKASASTEVLCPVPEYPYGLALLFMAVAGIYVVIRRRVTK